MNEFVKQTRVEPKKLREELLANIGPDEVSETGARLGAGARHPRAWVGPPFVYDLLGTLQFQLLTELGCREFHRFLEVGCGSLRLGRLAINYLLPGRYFGVEPDEEMLNAGCRMSFGAQVNESQIIAHKKARFSTEANFDYKKLTGTAVDYVFAQSIASHTGPKMTLDLLKGIASVSHNSTIAMVTFIRCGNPALSNKKEGWFYPECVSYTDEEFGAFAADAGFHAYRIAWPPLNIRDDGLITTQQPTILSRSEWRASLGLRFSSALHDGIVKIN